MITLEIPKITHILRTTAGVKRLTVAVSGWDNADTGWVSDFSVQVRERVSSEKFGRVFVSRFQAVAKMTVVGVAFHRERISRSDECAASVAVSGHQPGHALSLHHRR